MKKIYVPMIQYGDKEFDEGFIGWGFNSYDQQIRDAEGVLNIVRKKNMEILDVACGLGIYHSVWLKEGHRVTGTDISDTFIFMANQNNGSNPNASYRVENYYDLNELGKYDLVTIVDFPVDDVELSNNAFRALKPGGYFVSQVQNPDYKHVRGPVMRNYRSWTAPPEGNIILTRHEYNAEIDRWEYEEWSVDVDNAEITVQHNFSRILSMAQLAEMLVSAGFATVSFLDYNGLPYNPGSEEPKNYFCVAYKGEY